MTTLAFNEVEQVLRAAQAPVSAAEAHGCLCGALCTVAQFSELDWIQALLAEDDAESALQTDPALVQLYAQTLRSLESEDMDFVPLLPDDEVAINDRIAALANWAQGFLYGFGLGAPSAEQRQLPGDIPEVLADLSEIARAGDAGEEGEAVEQAYMELVEYLRTAVQLLHAELHVQRSDQPEPSPRTH